jgi:hypothetical protein
MTESAAQTANRTARTEIAAVADATGWTSSEVETPWARGRFGGSVRYAHPDGTRVDVSYTWTGRVASALVSRAGVHVEGIWPDDTGKRARVIALLRAAPNPRRGMAPASWRRGWPRRDTPIQLAVFDSRKGRYIEPVLEDGRYVHNVEIDGQVYRLEPYQFVEAQEADSVR